MYPQVNKQEPILRFMQGNPTFMQVIMVSQSFDFYYNRQDVEPERFAVLFP